MRPGETGMRSEGVYLPGLVGGDRGYHGWIHCLGERCRSITVEDLLRRDGETESATEGAV